jgi:hypothetical protein
VCRKKKLEYIGFGIIHASRIHLEVMEYIPYRYAGPLHTIFQTYMVMELFLHRTDNDISWNSITWNIV